MNKKNATRDVLEELSTRLNSLQRSNAMILERLSFIDNRLLSLDKLESYLRRREIIRINTGLSI
jgi:hypothetical protein